MHEEHRHMPDANRLSVLVSAVLLAYALAHLIETQHYALNIEILGASLAIPLNLSVAATLMAAGLTASGTDWLLRGHPHFEGNNTVQHWILPALTAAVLGVPLYSLPFGPAWWLSFGLGGVLLLLVFIAEYIALDAEDIRHPVASAGLVALSYALFLILTTTLSLTEARLTLIIAAIFPAAGMVTLRAFHLHTGKWKPGWAAGVAIILMQIAAGLHYWPLSPIQYGLTLLGPLFAMTNFALNIDDGISPRRSGLEAAIGAATFWLAAILFRG